MGATATLRDARSLREDELLELTHAVAKELDARGERLPKGWTEEAVGDLRSGRLTGWGAAPGPQGGAIGFFSRRGARAFGHAHLLPGPDPVGRAAELLDRIGSSPEVTGLSLTLGVTGLDPAEEGALVERWQAGTFRSVVVRDGLERSLDDPSLEVEPTVPASMRLVAADRVTPEAMADLDWRGFRDSRDAELFGRDPEENARMIDRLLAGGLGTLVDPASAALLDGEGRLAALVLSAELTPRIALVADLVVDPALRRAGHGRFLLRYTLRALRALGYVSARLWVTGGNLGARRLYDDLGFVPYARAVVYLQAAGPPVAQPQRDR